MPMTSIYRANGRRLKVLVSRVPILASALLAVAGCTRIPPTAVPIPSIPAVSENPSNDSLVIMLPGMGDRAEAFLTAGFLDVGDQWGFDILTIDAHYGYYVERSLIPRLHEDIIIPARASGYENIWLLGVSMGGFGSLLYASEYPDAIDGIILLAPYIGDRGLANEIEAAGGLHSWPGDADGFDEFEIRVWAWLKNVTIQPEGTPVILGYGRSDRLARSYGPLVEALDPSRVYKLDGGHGWTTWEPLWARIAANLEL